MNLWGRGASAPAVRDPLTWVVAALVTVPIVAAGIVGWNRPDVLASDLALINLRVGDVFGPETPLLGPFSRFDWNHPGPLMFWLLAPAWRVLGGDAGALWAAGAVANLVAAVGLVVLSRRLGGRRLLVVVGVATLALLIGTGPLVADPWNPYLAILPFTVFLLAAVAVATGDVVLVPVAVGVGSLLVQTHVGYALLVGVVGLWSAGWLGVSLWRAHRAAETSPSPEGSSPSGVPSGRRLAATGAATVLVALLAWSGPLIEQFTSDPGNLTLVLDYFTASDDPTIGSGEAVTVLGRQLSPLGPWLGGPEAAAGQATLMEAAPWWWALPALILLGGSVVVAWRHRWQAAALLGGTVAVGVLTAVVATSRITGFAYLYLLRFWWPLAMLCWVTIGWVALLAVPIELVRRHRPALTAAASVLAGVLLVAATASTASDPPELAGTEAVAAMADDVAAGLTPGGTYLIEPIGFSLFGELFGVVDALETRGFNPVAAARFTIHFAPSRTQGADGAPTDFDGTLFVATSAASTELADRPGFIPLASWDPLTPDERAEVQRLWTAARTALSTAGRDDVAEQIGNVPLETALALSGVEVIDIPERDRRRIDELEARGIPVTIYLAPPPDAGTPSEARRR